MKAGRARNAIRAANAAAIVTGFACAFLWLGRSAAAIAAIAVAVSLIILALLWALTQEDRRGA